MEILMNITYGLMGAFLCLLSFGIFICVMWMLNNLTGLFNWDFDEMAYLLIHFLGILLGLIVILVIAMFLIQQLQHIHLI